MSIYNSVRSAILARPNHFWRDYATVNGSMEVHKARVRAYNRDKKAIERDRRVALELLDYCESNDVYLHGTDRVLFSPFEVTPGQVNSDKRAQICAMLAKSIYIHDRSVVFGFSNDARDYFPAS